MTPIALAPESALASRSNGNGRNQRSRIRPTFLPFARISRMATLIGSEMVPMPIRITSASSAMYSSNHGFSGPRAEAAQAEACIVSNTEAAGISGGPLTDEAPHRLPQRGGPPQALQRFHPAHARRAAEHARAHGGRVLHDLELAVLALGHDVLGHELAVGDLLRDRLHDGVVRPDRIRGDDIDVGQRQRLGHRLAPRDQKLLVFARGLRRRDCRHILSLHRLPVGVLTRDAGRDLHATTVEVLFDLLVVLAAEPEAMRPHRGLLVADLRAEPRLVAGLVLAPRLPLAGVVIEGRLVDP